MPHTSLTGRTVRCDATVFSIGGTNCLALLTDATLTIDREVIEVTAPKDTWKQREQCGGLDWNLSATKMIVTPAFATLIVAGGAVLVSATGFPGGGSFYCPGLITGNTNSWDDPQTEALTIVGFGLAPVIG